jgi:pyruvate kinase
LAVDWDPSFETRDLAGLEALLEEVETLASQVSAEGARQAALWRDHIVRESFRPSAENLAFYLAVRRRDLRKIQRRLMVRGLSSLGRMESRVMPSLCAVRTAVAAICGRTAPQAPSAREMLAGERRLARARREVFGRTPPPQVALLVTCPSEAAEDPGFMLDLARRGVAAVRINCAHDDREAWARMIQHLRAAEAATGRSVKVLMDLAGPKIRTGAVRLPKKHDRVCRGDLLLITPPGGLKAASPEDHAVECTFPDALAVARAGHRILVDDGKLCAEVQEVGPAGVLARVTQADVGGYKLKPEKGLNFPDSALETPALTEKDRQDLEFVAAHADGVEFSFVQSAADIQELQSALAALRPADWRKLSLVLKIETARAVANLPEMIVRAAGAQPTAVMIARGDLAVEIGFARTAEMQEEMLWISEAASVPVIWATQVMERLIKKGRPSRGEMTDAAMAARAECVMLNKGPHLIQAIDQLQGLLARMAVNQHKKAPQLRQLKSWPGAD